MPMANLVRVAALALGASLAAGWSLPVLAQTPAEMEDAQALFAAGHALLAAVDEAERSGDGLPLLSESPLLIRSAFDVDLAQKLADAPIGLIRPVCEPAGNAKMAYLVTGTNEAEATSNDAEVRSRAMRAAAVNFVRYQDESALGMRFELRCSALMMPGSEEFVGSLTGEEAQEVAQDSAAIRGGHATTLDTAIVYASSPMTKPENAALLLEEIVRQAPVMARGLSLEQRRRLQARIDTVDRTHLSEGDQARYLAIRQALEDAECGPLCSS